MNLDFIATYDSKHFPNILDVIIINNNSKKGVVTKCCPRHAKKNKFSVFQSKNRLFLLPVINSL